MASGTDLHGEGLTTFGILGESVGERHSNTTLLLGRESANDRPPSKGPIARKSPTLRPSLALSSRPLQAVLGCFLFPP
jgi:hypothetical protein